MGHALVRGGGTIRRMRTLLIAGADPVPPRLRELVDRGSTSVREQRSVDPSAALSSDFDRVVIWASRDDTALQSLVALVGDSPKWNLGRFYVYNVEDAERRCRELGLRAERI